MIRTVDDIKPSPVERLGGILPAQLRPLLIHELAIARQINGQDGDRGSECHCSEPIFDGPLIAFMFTTLADVSDGDQHDVVGTEQVAGQRFHPHCPAVGVQGAYFQRRHLPRLFH